MDTATSSYALTRTPEETRRLQVQSQFLNPFTQRLFDRVGIAVGMRVLDLGSGAGDVSLLLADRVGPTGLVVGVDIDPTLIDIARARAQAAGHTNVSFVQGDIEFLQIGMEFDAIVGRLIFLHLHSPAMVLLRLMNYLRPGGIVAIQDIDVAHYFAGFSHPANQLIDRVAFWIAESFRRAGRPLRMGLDLYQIFLEAGLPSPQMIGEAALVKGPDQLGYDWIAETARTLLPLILKFDLATADEVGIDTLANRMRNEAIDHRLVLHMANIVSAWTFKPVG